MASQFDNLAMVYARSLFELAQQAGGQEKIVEIGDELEQICELARSDRSLGEFLRSPIIERKARSTAISRVLSDKVTDLTLRFLLVLNAKGRLGHLEKIASAYDHLVQESFGRVEVDLFTPTALEPDQLQAVKEHIQRSLNKEPVIYQYTDPSMLGGLKLKIADHLIDASVATRLRRLKDQLLSRGSTYFRSHFEEVIEETGGQAP